jgi:hypothetical protein
MSPSCDHLPAILAELQSVLPSFLLDPSLAGCRIAMGDDVDTETFVHSVTDTEDKVVLAGPLFDVAEKWVDAALDHVVMATVCPEDTTGVIETMCITFTVDNDLRATDIAAAITKPEALQSLLDYYNGRYASESEDEE